MPSRRSLRVRLVAIALALTAIGLTVAGAVTYTSIRSFLIERVDDDLRVASDNVAREELPRELRPRYGGPGRGRPPGQELPKGTVWAFRAPDGSAIVGTQGVSFPRRPGVGYRTVQLSGLGDYRLLTRIFVNASAPDTSAEVASPTLVVGIPLDDVNDTLRQLLIISLLVGALTLAAAGAGGYWLVRLGLRPLTDIEATSRRIADGDLSQRIQDTDPDTEVGRLGGSLNTMLGRIEEAFTEREASEARLRQFVADASHELQTPLTSVRGYAELFRRGAADRPEDLARAMQRIEAESVRMSTLVDDMLLLARLDQQRPMTLTSVDLTAVARELIADARVADPGRRYELRATAPVIVTGDADRLRQVSGNLLRNVAVHTPPGAPAEVRVRTVADQAVIEVSDGGPGVAPDLAQRVFERFVRADASRTRASGGSGLGLSIVAAIVAAHGGRVEVESPPGAGATFRVWLPLDGPDPQETLSTD